MNKDCYYCGRYKNMACPNSSKCLHADGKPYFIDKDKFHRLLLNSYVEHQRYIDNEPYTWEDLQNMKGKPVFLKENKEWYIVRYFSKNDESVHVISDYGDDCWFDYKDNMFYPREVK